MDGLWQIKCGSTLQSSTPYVASSASQEPRNQVEMNLGKYIYQHATQDIRSTLHERMHESMPPYNSNLGSCKSNNLELGNSFLALLSGPSSLLQCDFHELSNLKTSTSTRNVAFGNGVVHTSGALLSENLSCQIVPNGANIPPAIPARSVLSPNSSSSSILHDGNQATNLNLQTSDLAKAVRHHIFSGAEKVKEFSSLKGEQCGASSGSFWKLNGKTIQSSAPKIPLEAKSSMPDQLYTVLSGCPRVFCLGTSGYLLLSNTGLLGIVCACHFAHMSVSKFCEHSGLCDMNPGDAVHVDSGETISWWRKLYFEKFGIRVPEDQSGWDWPEGLSATAGLMKPSATMPKVSNVSNLDNLVCSSQGMARCGENIMLPNNPCTEQNLAIDPLSNTQPQNGTSCQSITAWIDSILKNGTASLTQPNLQNLRTVARKYDVNAEDQVTAGRGAASSNVELRLGQPLQHSWSLGNLSLQLLESKLLDTLDDPHKSCYIKRMIHSAACGGEKSESRQNFHSVPCPSNSAVTRELSQFNLGNNAYDISSMRNATNFEKFKGDVAKGSPAQPPEWTACSKDTNNIIGIADCLMSKTLHSESTTDRSHALNAPLNGFNNLERQRNVPGLGFFHLMDKSKVMGCIPDGPYVVTDPVFKTQKEVEDPGIFAAVSGGSSKPFFSAAHGKNYHTCQSSYVPPDMIGSKKFLNHLGKFPSLGSSGQGDHAYIRSMNSSVGSGQLSQSSAVPIGLPLANSTPLPVLTSRISNQEGIDVGPSFLDDNMRLLALRQILELSKQHAVCSIGVNQEIGTFGCASTPNIQHSLLDPSTSREQRHGPILSKQDGSEGTLTSLLSAATERLAPETGLNKWCNFSSMGQGSSLHSRENDMPCQFSSGHFPNKEPAPRLCRNESITRSSEHGKCCQRVPIPYFQGNCNCAAHSKCFEEYSNSRVGSSPVTPMEQLTGVRREASILAAPEFVRGHKLPKEGNNSLDQRRNLNEQIPRSNICHASQWRDVPNKQKGVCNVAGIDWSEKGACNVAHRDPSAAVLEGSVHVEGELGGASDKGYIESVKIADSLKEQDMSNISSGCSAPAVTQASVEVNNVDSSTVDAGETRYENGLIVDEGSGIDKCWSSDDALGSERSADFVGASCKTSLRKERFSKVLNGQSSRSLLDELKLIDSLTWKKGRNQIHMGLTAYGKTKHLKEIERGSKPRKRKRVMKLKMLNASFPSTGSAIHHEYSNDSDNPVCLSGSSKDGQMLLSSRRGTLASCPAQPGTFSSTKVLSRKRDLNKLYNSRYKEDDHQQHNAGAKSGEILEVSGRKKIRRAWVSDSLKKIGTQDPIPKDTGNTTDLNPTCGVKVSSSLEAVVCHRKAKPMVFGKYGEICSGELAEDKSRPTKIVPLSWVLKSAERCAVPKSCKPKRCYMGELKNKITDGSISYFDLSSDLKNEETDGNNHDLVFHEVNNPFAEEAKKACAGASRQSDDESSILEKGRHKSENNIYMPNGNAYAQSSFKCKEIRKRSINELTMEGKTASVKSSPDMRSPSCTPKMKRRKSLKRAGDSRCHLSGSGNIIAEKSIEDPSCWANVYSDAFCCVCGSSNNDEVNSLLKCSRCSIRVHQACYGVPKIPKGQWYCRPCRTNSKDVVCVLCGYGGGAMTRALQSRMIVKTLLKAWNIDAECRHKNTNDSAGRKQDDQSLLHASGSVLDDSSCFSRHETNGPLSTMWKMDKQNQLDIIQNSLCCVSNLKVHNSITAGVLDSTVKQWVHMVCALWTPGTRCPNVDSMSAFDVSGAPRPRESEVCSLCNRPGGSCIECRVMNCSVRFHPWCAHQKGLLQSEVEGADNEKVGFYGRCMFHATHPTCASDVDPSDTDMNCQGEKELTCARTEGFKGRKRDGLWHSIHGKSKVKSGCFVPQEQLNAWAHINGQKSCQLGLPKLLTSDIEYDCRKEYARYKQSKGWKHLVVYKSGIHGLGLYTSRFISRGEMVVEYVGEIVGLRVADKRENEYQSGRKVQYKSACYFFRIDKEHIIDATRKGGIARFVNHSCLPNCVAKVISVRNEKKVVFFAERDIYPGEEITYDYHFNHEDEGKKIPCFCNSKNCRRYLN